MTDLANQIERVERLLARAIVAANSSAPVETHLGLACEFIGAREDFLSLLADRARMEKAHQRLVDDLVAKANEARALAADLHNKPAKAHLADPALERMAYAMAAKCDHFIEAAEIARQAIPTPDNFRLFGFATGSYMCHCHTCKVEFEGDKRAITCLPCALTRAETTARQDGSAERDGGAGVPVRSLSVHETDKSDRAEGVAALQQAGDHIAEVGKLIQQAAEGWALVPKEPTEEMIRAGLDAHAIGSPYETPFGPDGSFADQYRAMIAAAPLPQQTDLVEPYSSELDEINGRLA